MDVIINGAGTWLVLSDAVFVELLHLGWQVCPYCEHGNVMNDGVPIVAYNDKMTHAYGNRFAFSTPYFLNNEKSIRTNAVLIGLIRRLGERANTSHSKIKIVGIPDHISWRIEYGTTDGINQFEVVKSGDRIWW